MTEVSGDHRTAAGTGPAVLVPALLATLTAGTLLLGALVPRDLSQGEDAPLWNNRADLLAYDLSRAVNVAVLLTCACTIVVATIRRGFPRAGLSLWASYLAFVASNFVLPGLVAREPGFDQRLFVPPVLFTAVYLARPMAPGRLVAAGKATLLAFVYASLAAAVVLPDNARAAGFAGIVPGVDFRLYGIGGGATSLGTLSAAYLTIEMVSPSPSRARWLHLAAAATALVLTQARTSWLFVLAVLAVLGLQRVRRRLAPSALWAGPSAVAAKAGLAGLAFAALAAGSVAALARAGLLSTQGDALVLLTGRPYIWATSLTTWLESPVFGYGLGLWESAAYRARHGGFDHAHNQFLHSLASAGVVGLLGLIAYLRAAWVISRRAAASSPAPFVLLLGVLVLCLTNTPLRGYYILDAFVVLHLLLFALLMQIEKLPPEGAVPPPDPSHRQEA